MRIGPIDDGYDAQAFQDFGAYCDGVMLPRGVHILSKESQAILARAAEKAAAAAARHIKRGS